MGLTRRIRHIFHPLKRIILYENGIAPILYRFCCRLHLIKPEIIVYVDGGICSQMHQYLLGRYYSELGYNVSYNLAWYRRNGKDKDGVHPRFFELTDMWPAAEFKVADKSVPFYASHFPVRRNGMHFPLEIYPPAYLNGYYSFDDNLLYRALFQRYFSLDKVVKTVKTRVVEEWEGTKCAIHVRRGDLAKMNDVFYGRVSVDYFRKAIDLIGKRYDNIKLFIFSDGFDWVEKELASYYSSYPHELVKGNLAFEDLTMMAKCDCFISSQGSAGKFAAMINGRGLLIVGSDQHDAIWKERYQNTVILDT